MMTNEKCDHKERKPTWDHVYCLGCGHVWLDGGREWGIAARKDFNSMAEAEFYRDNGRLPEAV